LIYLAAKGSSATISNRKIANLKFTFAPLAQLAEQVTLNDDCSQVNRPALPNTLRNFRWTVSERDPEGEAALVYDHGYAASLLRRAKKLLDHTLLWQTNASPFARQSYCRHFQKHSRDRLWWYRQRWGMIGFVPPDSVLTATEPATRSDLDCWRAPRRREPVRRALRRKIDRVCWTWIDNAEIGRACSQSPLVLDPQPYKLRQTGSHPQWRVIRLMREELRSCQYLLQRSLYRCPPVRIPRWRRLFRKSIWRSYEWHV